MTKIPLVNLYEQYLSIKDDIDNTIKDIITTTSFVGGQHIVDFENNFANYLGAKHVIGCGNGTDSIEIILKAMGIGVGDEVIVPALSWISTSEAVSSIGAIPVFVDIEEDYYTINTILIEEKITKRTRAIIPVHLYGHPANITEIMRIAKKYNLKVIEDCAQSHGATINKKMTGTFGHASSFSFFPSKNLGAYGDAGGIATSDASIAEKSLLIARHGQKGRHNHIIEGRNSRLDTLQAAILNVKLPHLERWTDLRIQWSKVYNDLLGNAGLSLPQTKDNYKHVFHLYVVRTSKRERLHAYLKDQGIETTVHYPTALPFLPCYKSMNKKPDDYPVAFSYQSEILSLPMFPELKHEDLVYISNNISQFERVQL